MKKIIVALLVIGLLSVGAYALSTYRLVGDQDPTVTYDNSALSESEVNEEFENARSSFWVDNDYEKSYQEHGKLAEAIAARNASSEAEDLTEEALNDEATLKLAHANSATHVSIQEALRLYAEIYNNTVYSDNLRADALFRAMDFIVEKIGTQMTVDQVHSWVFVDNLFGPVLAGEDLPLDQVNTKFEVLEKVVSGLSEAEKLSTSNKVDVQILALSVHVELALAATLLEERYELEKVNGESLFAFIDRTDKNGRAHLDELFINASTVDERIRKRMSDTNTYPRYSSEFINALNDVINAYIRFQYHGYDVYPKIASLNTFIQDYIGGFQNSFDERHKNLADVQNAINGLVTACSYLYESDDEKQNINRAITGNLIQPFLDLSTPLKKLLTGVNRLGILRGTCYEQYVIMGQQFPEFQDALIADVGGWTAEQFK